MADRNDIDQLFSQGFGEEQYPYKETSWQQMSELLDRDKRRRRAWWMLGLLLSIGILTAAVMMLPVNDRVTSTIASEGEIEQTSASTTMEAVNSTMADTQTANTTVVNEERRATTRKSRTSDEGVSSSNAFNLAANEDGVQVPTSNASSVETTIVPIPDDLESLASATDYSSYGVDRHFRSIASPSQQERLSSTTDELPSMEAAVNERPATVLQGIAALDVVPMAQATTTTLPSTDYILPAPRNKRWLIELAGGPELSVLMTESAPRVGSRFGIKVGYFLTDKWSIHAGVLYSQKLFNGAGTEYENSDVFTDALPDKMEGKSSFLELPIVARYHLKGKRRWRQYVEVGLTNFNHRSEWYGFEYRPEDESVNLMKEIPMQEVNKMALGAARLAYGLQTTIDSQLELSIIPYLQVPLRGVGSGNVSIYNTGLEFSLGYRL